MEQRVGRVRLADGTSVAFASVGAGPVLLFPPGWVSHIELEWALAPARRFYEALAHDRTLVRYDRPGVGMSESASSGDLVAVELQVMAAVLGAVGADRVDLLGTSMSGPLALLWAATHPETVRRLVVYGGWANGDRLGDGPLRSHVLGLVEQHWGLGSDLLTELFAPGADAEFRAAFAMMQREAATAKVAQAVLDAAYSLNVDEDLGRVKAPTVVIHREHDRAVPLSEGERIATGVPDARLVVLPGRAHIAFAGDTDSLLDAIRSALELPPLRDRYAPRLTARQLEVAALVAQGLTNREIAQKLVISERSAESHVERIRLRLGLRSRAQLAVWFATTRA